MCSAGGAAGGDDATNAAASACNTHKDPSNDVEGPHEVAGSVLVKVSVSVHGIHPLLFGGISGDDVAGGEVTGLSASENKTSDVPGESTATGSATEKAHNG